MFCFFFVSRGWLKGEFGWWRGKVWDGRARLMVGSVQDGEGRLEGRERVDGGVVEEEGMMVFIVVTRAGR